MTRDSPVASQLLLLERASCVERFSSSCFRNSILGLQKFLTLLMIPTVPSQVLSSLPMSRCPYPTAFAANSRGHLGSVILKHV